MLQRAQRTLRREATASGIGFITGADVSLRFIPAPANSGIVFQRVDLADKPMIAATLDNLVPRSRRTGIAANGASVDLIEHVMAALAGLQIDNCLVQCDAPEMPGFDGSCLPVVDCLLQADFEIQAALKPQLVVTTASTLQGDDGSLLKAKPAIGRGGLTITYLLDYGLNAAIHPQLHTFNLTPEGFVNEIAFARTFVLESEVAVLKAQGIGRRSTTQDLLVFGANGVIDNALKAADECARHKLLDCIGDFALTGCEIHGFFHAWRTGHRQNHDMMKRLVSAAADKTLLSRRAA